MLDHALAARRMAEGRSREDLDSNEMLRLALIRAVEVIGEAAYKVSQAGRGAHPEVPWSYIVGTRHRLIHGYDAVNLDILWQIVSDDLPPLIAQIQAILAEKTD